LSDRWGLDIFPISGAVGPDGDIAQPATPFENERESPSQQALPSQPSDVNCLEVLASLNPRQHQSGTSIDRVTRISKIGNAVLRAALYMPATSAMRYNPAIVALVARLKSQGRLKPKQIVVAAMRKLLVLCFGALKTGKPFDPAIAMGC
jgi:Transposase IS116/IS110/IS902 family